MRRPEVVFLSARPCVHVANFLSALGRLARRPKNIRAIRELIDKVYLGALQGAQKEFKKFAVCMCTPIISCTALILDGVLRGPDQMAVLSICW